jgi:hypothetical protein
MEVSNFKKKNYLKFVHRLLVGGIVVKEGCVDGWVG